MLEFQLKLVGGILIALALVHIFFPNYFQWKKELPQLSLINRQMMQVHTFFIAFTVFLMGLLCVTSASEMTTTPFGRKISLALALFWGIRLMIQFFGYSSKLWKGKVFETTVHLVFSLLWGYFAIIFFRAGWTKDILF